MNKFNTIMKVISALAAVIGAVYIVATYGDKIVEWAKKLMGCNSTPIATFHYTANEAPKEEAAPAAETTEETAPAPEAAKDEPVATAQENTAAPEAPATDDSTPVASDEDFEG